MKKIQKLEVPKDYDMQNGIRRKINEIIDYLNNQANGETPEVDNTVGQVGIDIWSKFNNDRANIIANCPEGFMQGCAHLLDYLKKNNYLNKPVETDKEYPIVIWKLHTKYTSGNSKSPILFFKGTVKELKLYIESVHLNKNIGFIITDFENLG